MPRRGKEYITVSLVAAQRGRSSWGNRAKSGAVGDSEVSATLDTNAKTITLKNNIPTDRREAGTDKHGFSLCAGEGKKDIFVSCKKNLATFSTHILSDLSMVAKRIANPERIVMDGVKGSLKDCLITEGLSASDAGQVVNLAVSKPLSSILAAVPSKEYVDPKYALVSYKEALANGGKVNESWKWNGEATFLSEFTGGSITFYPRLDTSIYQWSRSIYDNGGMSGELMSFTGIKIGANISANGSSAEGEYKALLSFGVRLTSEFFDGIELDRLNKGICDFNIKLQLSISF